MDMKIENNTATIKYDYNIDNFIKAFSTVTTEARGKTEEEFKKMVEQSNLNGIKGMFDFHCVSKKANLPGLQLADLVARPIGVHYLHPEQHNRAWEMLLPKMRTSYDGKLEGYGLKIYPQFDPTE